MSLLSPVGWSLRQLYFFEQPPAAVHSAALFYFPTNRTLGLRLAHSLADTRRFLFYSKACKFLTQKIRIRSYKLIVSTSFSKIKFTYAKKKV